MADQTTSTPAPPLNIPKSTSTVEVSIINAECYLTAAATLFVQPHIAGQDYLNMPTFAFLISNERMGKRVLFDVGMRKDWWNLSPLNTTLLERGAPGMRIDKQVDEILQEAGVELSSIDELVWSHAHLDHTGDPSKFPSSTGLVVGPSIMKNFMPGYPTNPDGLQLDSDFAGRNVREIDFEEDFKIGDYAAHDFFGDGSLYLLSTPGHAIGHMSALARTTADTFLFLGGDICHFDGTFRPSQRVPLPETMPESVPLDTRLTSGCSCSSLTACHPAQPDESQARTTPFYLLCDRPGLAYQFPVEAQASVNSMRAFDADPNILICIAHDVSLLPVLKFFPDGNINDWQSKGWKDATRWGWLNEMPYREKEGDEWKPGRPMLVDALFKNGEKLRSAQELLDQLSGAVS